MTSDFYTYTNPNAMYTTHREGGRQRDRDREIDRERKKTDKEREGRQIKRETERRQRQSRGKSLHVIFCLTWVCAGFVHAVCLSLFSIAMKKKLTKSDLGRKGLILSYSSR